MDRPISAEVRRKALGKKIAIGVAAALAVAAAVVGIGRCTEASVSEASLRFAAVDRGDVDAGITGSGSVVPALEQIVNSPISSRVVEVYHRPGDIVDAGTPLLRLDLDAARTAYDSERDKLAAMLRLQLRQLRANNITRLSDLKMQVEVSRMQLSRREVELRNERYLDSIGSGTADRVREVELQLKAARLELQQLEQQLANETDVKQADEQLKQLEIEIQEKSLAQQARTLGDAEIRSPRRATVTSISNRLGSAVSAGQQVAVIADLGHYRVDARIAERYAADIHPGSPVRLKVSRDTIAGTVSAVAPTASNGYLDISVALECDSLPILRPGVSADLRVSSGLRADVVRVPNASFYTGPGTYQLYATRPGSGRLELRGVVLGGAGYDHVEVVSGLEPGERIVISDTKQFNNQPIISLK